MNAWDELQEFLEDGENLESLCFGGWGGGFVVSDGEKRERAYDEPIPVAVPLELRGKVLRPEDAKPLMDSWSFSKDTFGGAECYATYIWTSDRVIYVSEYDGTTGLASMPRNPIETMPVM